MKSFEDMLTEYQDLIDQNIANPYFTNADLAREMNVSERTLYRVVQRQFGLSPTHHLREVRFDLAADMLRSGHYRTVKEVALRVGYLKVSYFSNKFEEVRGVRPSELLNR